MPSACEARSCAYIARAEASATDCGSLMRIPALSAGELRVALCGECGDALRIILRTAELTLKIAFLIECLLERAAPRLIDRLLGPREAAGRCDRELLGERVDGL